MCLMWMGTQKEGKVRSNTMVKAILELEVIGIILFCLIAIWLGVGSIWLSLAKDKEDKQC